jgi:hypothetical protein
MGYAFEFNPTDNSIMVRAWGTATAVGTEALGRDLAQHPQMQPDADILCDYRNWDMSGLTAQDVRARADFARNMSKTWGSGRSAYSRTLFFR